MEKHVERYKFAPKTINSSNMDKLKILILSVVILCFLGIANKMTADTSGEPKSKDMTSGKKTVLSLSKKGTARPNALSNIGMECFYGDGFIEFEFPEGVQYLYVKVYDMLFEFEGIVTKDSPTLEIPSHHGEYNIECTTDDGRMFSGIIII